MRVTVTFSQYNVRRFNKPWIARVTAWPIGKQPVLTWGGLVGLTAEIDAAPGQIIRYGQKDMRGNNTQSDWAVVQQDGGLLIVTAEAARQQWLDGCPAPHVDTTGEI